jgi:hypothetical protein
MSLSYLEMTYYDGPPPDSWLPTSGIELIEVQRA